MPSTFRIKTADAIRLVSAFVNDPPLALVARDKALGGTINKISAFGSPNAVVTRNLVSFDIPTFFDGVLGWFCWNDSQPGAYPPFFIAFERNDSYLNDRRTAYPDMQKLMRPSHVFRYATEDIATLLRTHKVEPSEYRDYVITRPEVIELSNNFLVKLPKREAGDEYNCFPYSFFENETTSDFKNFLDQGIEYIRYYFGYDSSSDYDKTNRLRIILIGVDSAGQNIFNDSAGVWMLQHSWPPPPYAV